MKPFGPRELGLLVAALALALDQGSKTLLLYGFGLMHLPPGAAIGILPFFNLVMVWNPGVSYGLFPATGPEGTAILATFSLVAVGVLGFWLSQAGRRMLALGLGLAIGGALGNLVDRLVYGKVADFFHFYAFGHDWYVFNLADVAITLGVLTLLYSIATEREPQPGKAHPGEAHEE